MTHKTIRYSGHALEPTMRLTYETEADAFYLRLAPSGTPIARTIVRGPDVHVDVDRDGQVIGIEVLAASQHFEPDSLVHLRPPETWMTLAEAQRESGLKAATLRLLLNKGRLTGRRRGRDWLVSLTDLYNYLESRAPQGRPAKSFKARSGRRTSKARQR